MNYKSLIDGDIIQRGDQFQNVLDLKPQWTNWNKKHKGFGLPYDSLYHHLSRRPIITFPKEYAQEIIEAHEIDMILRDKEEVKALKDNNPNLLISYQSLVKYAKS